MAIQKHTDGPATGLRNRGAAKVADAKPRNRRTLATTTAPLQRSANQPPRAARIWRVTPVLSSRQRMSSRLTPKRRANLSTERFRA